MTDFDLRPLGWVLIHFLWQGSLVAMLLAGLLQALPRADARIRYVLSCLALVTMASWPLATGLLRGSSPSTATPAASPTGTAVDAVLGWVVVAWGLGVLLVGTRHLRAWFEARRWVESRTVAVTGPILARFQRMAATLRVARPVRLLASTHVDVPSTLGCLRPVVLVPASLLTGLPATQLDALLAHELAHVRRWDYAINLLQVFVETALFYHPAVWWVSRQIRIERESCCDDVAVALCADRRVYVEALTTLETMRGTNMAMSASGGSLLTRVRRLLEHGRNDASTGSMGGLLAVTLLLMGLTVAVNGCDGGGPADQGETPGVSADGAAKSEGTSRFVSEEGQLVELKRPEGMTEEEFRQHLHENWTSVEEAHGELRPATDEDNTFVVESEAHERFVIELVQRGLAEEGETIKLEFGEQGMIVNGRPVDPEDLAELKEIMHGGEQPLLKFEPVIELDN